MTEIKIQLTLDDIAKNLDNLAKTTIDGFAKQKQYTDKQIDGLAKQKTEIVNWKIAKAWRLECMFKMKILLENNSKNCLF